MSLGAASFNLGATKEFIPKGKMVNTKEEFPDMDALLDDGPKSKKGKKGKKKGKVQVDSNAAADDEDIDNSVPWKGKKSEFFVMK